jgi:hypothetical protein
MMIIQQQQWLLLSVAVLALCQDQVASFSTRPSVSLPCLQQHQQHQQASSSALAAKKRKAKKQVDRSRPNQFYESIDDAVDKPKPKKTVATPVVDPDEAERAARTKEARQRMEQRPEVSTMIIDEETGIEVVAQGKSVMDVVTRKAVKLSPAGPMNRLAQMFPGVPPEIRDRDRFDWQTVQVPDMVTALQAACVVKLADGTRAIPPHPSVADKAIDFVLANRDYMGQQMKSTLGRLRMRSMSLGNKQQAEEYQALWKNFLTLENHVSAPFRQIIMDAEGRMGPNFGNLDLKSFATGDLYERCANYLVLKGMVAHWEKKVKDAEYTERVPQTKENYVSIMSRGDPRRFLPDPPILFTLRECTQVCLMAQQMTKAFTDDEELFGDFPSELKFLEQALAIQGGTPMRKFMIDEFCPAQGITPDGLREGMRRLLAQLDNMQIDPYGDICNLLERLIKAMSVGSDDERDPYQLYLTNKDPNGPGAFQTYTFNHEKLSLVRFLDSQYEGGGSADAPAASPAGGLSNFFNQFGGGTPEAPPAPKVQETTTYKVPKARAAGRPHDLGWLDLLDDDSKKDDGLRLGNVPAGKVIVEEE